MRCPSRMWHAWVFTGWHSLRQGTQGQVLHLHCVAMQHGLLYICLPLSHKQNGKRQIWNLAMSELAIVDWLPMTMAYLRHQVQAGALLISTSLVLGQVSVNSTCRSQLILFISGSDSQLQVWTILILHGPYAVHLVTENS